jgi:hypothetical protein
MGRRTVTSHLIQAVKLIAFAGALLYGACTNPMRDTLALVVKDYSTPRTTVSVSSGMGISTTTPIVFGFTETMETSTLILGGTMANESDGGKWSSTTNPSDTLTVSARTAWSVGSGKVLVVNCKDLQGYDSSSLVLTYGVLDGVVYVRALDGDDNNPGTPDLPKKTITTAIALAAKYYSTAEVHVAEGVYNVSYAAGTHVVMAQGISLYGGYDPANWSNRNYALFVSKIKDISTTPSSQKYRAVDCGTNLTSSTLLDGFTIVGGGGTGTISVGVYCDASNLTISQNDINGGSGDIAAAIRISNSSPLVQNNSINGGDGVSSMGVFTYNCSAVITGNTISWGNGSDSAYGIINTQSTPRIEGNTIGGTVGMPNYSCGIYNDNSNAVILRNSIDGGYGYISVSGIENGAGSAAKIYNNTIHAGIGPSGRQVFSMGISNVSSSATIQCNTIDIGNPGQGLSGAYSMAIGINISSCTSIIDDNIVFSNNGSVLYQDQYGIVEAGPSSSPVHFYNNSVYNCPTALYFQYPSTFHGNFTALNLLAWAKVNISANPVFQKTSWPSPDWHLTASSPTSVTQGGLTLTGTDLNADKDLVSRSAPWSIGAYEY